MQALRIPPLLSEAAAGEDCGGIRNWVAALPAVVADLVQRWALQVAEPYEPGGQCSWVAPARTSAGADLVLKVGWHHPEAAQEADALRLWRGDGAVRLHAAVTSDRTSALLLERCAPGTQLGRSTPEPSRTWSSPACWVGCGHNRPTVTRSAPCR